jgi:hypothetical protein
VNLGSVFVPLVVVIAAVASSGCFPVGTPPAKVNGGGAVRLGDDAGYRFSAGTHVASAVASRNFPLDVGVGYVQQGYISDDKHATVHGLYLDGGPRLGGGRNWRAFAGPRFEYYFLPSAPNAGYATLLQYSVEAFVPVEAPVATTDGTDEDGNTTSSGSFFTGLAYGTLAIGLDLYGGYQSLPANAGLPMLGAGLYVRIPATVGLACCAWDFAKK